MSKATMGNFFEDFRLGQKFVHATSRRVTEGDRAVYLALYGSRFPLQGSDEFARQAGFESAPVDELLVFHIVLGKSVADISLNAVVNLGYAECVFVQPVQCGDALTARSEIIGLKENSQGNSGIVYVRTQGFNQQSQMVLSYVRWVMVRKRNPSSAAPGLHVPELARTAALPEPRQIVEWNFACTGSPHRFDDYLIGEKIDHLDGVTVEEAEHQMATRLYQNTARVHFNGFAEAQGRFGRRLVYGGHVMSLARTLSFNGLANAYQIAAINGGRHGAPLFAGGTVFAWSEIKDKRALPGRSDVGAVRIITRATRDLPCAEFPLVEASPENPGVILELDYWAFVPC